MTFKNRWFAASLLVLPLLLLAACGGSDSTDPGDVTAPTVAITDDVAGATATGNVTFTFTFSEDIGTSFGAADVTLTGGTKGTFTKVSATVTTLVAIPTAAAAGTLTVTVAAGAFTDLAGNASTAAATASQAYDTRVADTTPPTVAISDDVAAATATGNVTFTFTFSEDVGTSFTASDVTVTGGTAGAFATVSATVSTLVVAPTAASTGTISVTVPAGSFSDLAGNNNAAAATATQDYNTNALAQMDLPVTFDSATVNYALGGFGGAEDSSVVADPAGGANKVAKVVKSATAETWAGTSLTPPANGTPKGFATRIPLDATHTRMTVRTWSPDVGVHVRLKVEDKTNPTISVETEAVTTVANAWETLTFDFLVPTVPPTAGFNAASTYDLASIFFNYGTTGATAGAKTYYFDDLAWVSTANGGGGGGGNPGSAATQVVFDDTLATGVTYFGYVDVPVTVTNVLTVDTTEFHSGTASLRVDVPAADWIGGTLLAPAPQNLTAFNAVSYWVKASKPATLNATGLGDFGPPGPNYKAESLGIPLTTTWTRHVIPIPDPTKLTANLGLFHFAEGSEGPYSIWFDDIQYVDLSTAELGTATGGANISWPVATIGLGGTLQLVPAPNVVHWDPAKLPANGGNLTDLSFRYFTLSSSDPTVATVDQDGLVTALKAGTTNLSATFSGVAVPGVAIITVTAPLAVPTTTLTPDVAVHPVGNVVSVYNSAAVYTDQPVVNWFPNWGQATTFTDAVIAGKTVKKYSGMNYQGWTFDGTPVNASTFTHLHVDIWTPNATKFGVAVINPASTPTEFVVPFNASTTPTITQGAWISLDIPLTAFTGMTFGAISQIKWVNDAAAGAGGAEFGTFYIDNVYFWK